MNVASYAYTMRFNTKLTLTTCYPISTSYDPLYLHHLFHLLLFGSNIYP